MQFSTVATTLLFAAITVSAAPRATSPPPPPPPSTCVFNGSYRCATTFNGIEQCGYKADGTLGYLKIGDCPVTTKCDYIAGIPYCVAK